MKLNNVIENNVLIAKFMGWDGLSFNTPPEYDICQSFKEGNGTESMFFNYIKEELEYHCSWDWLMSVVEKIEQMGYRFEISFNTIMFYDIVNESFSTTVNIQDFSGIKNENLSKIEVTYLAIIEFIEYHNLNNN